MDNFKSAVILAGGKSSRMGFDKQFLVIDQKRLILKIAKNLEKHFDDILIVSNKRGYYENCKYSVIEDELKDMGPLAGISVALKYAKSNYIYIVACDMPSLDDRYIKYIQNKIEKDIKLKSESEIYLAKIDDKIQLFHGFYKKELGDEINSYLLNGTKKSIISFYEKNNKKVTYINEDEFTQNKFNKSIFINLNTREDLSLYQENFYLEV